MNAKHLTKSAGFAWQKYPDIACENHNRNYVSTYPLHVHLFNLNKL